MLTVNPSDNQILARTRSRVQRLQQAIAQEKNKDKPDLVRIGSLQKEVESKINNLKSLIGEFECLR